MGAIRAFRHTRPAAVILDIGLADLDGHEVCRQLKAIDPGPVIIALTGWGQDADREMGKMSGFNAYVTKPADSAHLTALLNELLAGSGHKSN